MLSSTLEPTSGTLELPDQHDILVLAREFGEAARALDSLLRKLEARLCPASSLQMAECSGCVAGYPNHSMQGFQARLLALPDQYPHIFLFLAGIQEASDS